MFRTAVPRGLRPLGSNLATVPHQAQSITRLNLKAIFHHAAKSEPRTKVLSLCAYRNNTALIRSYVSGAAPGTSRNPELEESARRRPIQAAPEMVSSSSSIHPAFSEVGEKEKEDDTDMMAGIKHDIKVIGEVFNLKAVPREALVIGLAGVIPYLATSAATVFCAEEMKSAVLHGSGFLMSEQSAEAMLHILEPLQVGYGAVILSCLGTIHWGLEWAKYGRTQGYKRYVPGMVTPAVAWPTILMPVEYALITQFLGFTFLYSYDSSATTKGWAPPWYGSYRFILTAIVGGSIVVSLIGRGQIQDRVGRAPTATERIREFQMVGVSPVEQAQPDRESVEDEE